MVVLCVFYPWGQLLNLTLDSLETFILSSFFITFP
jgi:hypothetical protein